MVTTYNGTAIPMIACQLQCGTVHSNFGTSSAARTPRCPASIAIAAATTAVTNAPGTAQRLAKRSSISHTTNTGATTAALEVVSARNGARHSGKSTPASMAWATSTGMAVINRPNRSHRPVTTISTPVTAKAPTAAGQPPLTAPVPVSNAAPGVDQASVIGRR